MTLDSVLEEFAPVSPADAKAAASLYAGAFDRYLLRHDKVSRSSFRSASVLLSYERALQRHAGDYAEAVVRQYLRGE